MRWLEEGERKLKSAELLLKEGYYDSACLIGYLGARISLYQLIEQTEEIFSHPSLLFMLKKFPDVSSGLLHSAKILETYSLPLRIPASVPEGVPSDYIDRAMAEEALKHAKAIMEFVKREVG